MAKVAPGVYRSRSAEQDMRIAWAAVVALPLAFVLASVVGEALISLLGYDPAETAVPVWAVLAAGVPALLILIAPGVVAVSYGLRAYRAGRRAARWPAWIGGALAVLALGVNLLAFVVGR
jgi:hypothetical protein